ncbi:MAG TPA: hypothetical protein DG753_00440 [Clostridium sp.]|nr:hypothetical protein [Clostridium sp.]
MDTSTIIAFILVLATDVVFFLRERKYVIKYKGRNRLGLLIPAVVLVIVALSLISQTIKITDLFILIPMIPLAFLGNKCGVTEQGILSNCYLTTWDKIDQFSIGKINNKQYMLQYKSGSGIRKIFFNIGEGEDVDKYLSGMRKLRHRRVN